MDDPRDSGPKDGDELARRYEEENSPVYEKEDDDYVEEYRDKEE